MSGPQSKPLAGHHVAVLLGGLSSEREVSLVSGRECADALERLGAKVSRVDAGRDLAQVLSKLKPDELAQAVAVWASFLYAAADSDIDFRALAKGAP